MRNFCLTIITKHVKHFHPELTSATINNTANPANQQRIKETLPTLPSNAERGVCSRVRIVMFAACSKCHDFELLCIKKKGLFVCRLHHMFNDLQMDLCFVFVMFVY